MRLVSQILLFILSFILFAQEAYAQSPVIQSGSVTQGHVPWWVTDGVIGDSGTANNNTITSMGATGQGPIICANSGPISSPRNQVCIGSDSNSGYLYFNTPINPPSLLVSINGAPTPFLTQQGSITPGDATCWVSTGIIKDCGPSTGVIQQGVVTANDFACWAGNGIIKDCGTQTFVTQTGAVTANDATCWSATGIIKDCGAPPAFVSGTPTTNDPACWANATTLVDCGGSFVKMTPPTLGAVNNAACWVNVNVIQDCGVPAIITSGTPIAGRPSCWVGTFPPTLQACTTIFVVQSGTITNAGDPACWVANNTIRDCNAQFAAISGSILAPGDMTCWANASAINDCGMAPGRAWATSVGLGSNYTIASGSADCGKTFFLGGTNLLIALGPPANYPSGCRVKLTNLSNSGAQINVNGSTNGIFGYNGCGLGNLCFQQTVEYINLVSQWYMSQDPGPWRPPYTITWFASPSGSNSNDCLSTSSACKLDFLCNQARQGVGVDVNTTTSPTLIINLAAGTYVGPANGTLCSISGNLGAGSTILVQMFGPNYSSGLPTAIIAAGSAGQGIYANDLGEVQVTNLGFYSAGGNGAAGIQAKQYSVVDIEGGNVFGQMGSTGGGGTSIIATTYASINIGQSIIMDNVAGAGCPVQTTFIEATQQGAITTSGIPPNIIFNCVNANFSLATLTVFGGRMDLSGSNLGTKVSMGGTGAASVTGAQVSYPALPGGMGSCLLTDGQTLDGMGVPGSIKSAIPSSTCADFDVQTHFARIPGCGTATIGTQYYMDDLAAPAAWGTVVTTGTGSVANGALISCALGGGFVIIGR